MSTEPNKTATIRVLNTAIATRSATHDYSYGPEVPAEHRAERLAHIRPNLIGNHDVVRILSAELLKSFESMNNMDHSLPDSFRLRIFTHGDIFLMMRAHFTDPDLLVSVRLGLQTNGLAQRIEFVDPSDVTQRLSRQRWEKLDQHPTAVGVYYASGMNELMKLLGMNVIEVHDDGATISISYLWKHDDNNYVVNLVSRIGNGSQEISNP